LKLFFPQLARTIFVVDGSPNEFAGVVLPLHEVQRGINLHWSDSFGMQGCQLLEDSESCVGDSFRKHLEPEDKLSLQIRALLFIAYRISDCAGLANLSKVA
jgi:hypothetical protein